MTAAPRILLPFLDDSTLFFARAMRALLAPLGAETVVARVTGNCARFCPKAST